MTLWKKKKKNTFDGNFPKSRRILTNPTSNQSSNHTQIQLLIKSKTIDPKKASPFIIITLLIDFTRNQRINEVTREDKTKQNKTKKSRNDKETGSKQMGKTKGKKFSPAAVSQLVLSTC